MNRILLRASIALVPFLAAGCATNGGGDLYWYYMTCPCGFTTSQTGTVAPSTYHCTSCREQVYLIVCKKCARSYYDRGEGVTCTCGRAMAVLLCPRKGCDSWSQYDVEGGRRYQCHSGHVFQGGYCGACKRWRSVPDASPLRCTCGASLFADRNQARAAGLPPTQKPAPPPAVAATLEDALRNAWNRSQHDFAGAAGDYDAIVNRWPGSAEAKFARAEYNLRAVPPRIAKAAAEFLSAAESSGGHPQARVMVALIRADEGNPSEAVAELERHLAKHPGDTYAVLLAAGFEAMAGREQASEARVKSWRKAAFDEGRTFPKLALNTPLANRAYAAATSSIVNMIERDARAARLVGGDPDNDEALALAAGLETLHRDPNRGLVREADSAVLALAGRLANIYHDLRQFPAAAGCWSDVLRWYPSYAPAFGNRAVMRRLAGDRVGALADFDAAATVSGDHSWVFHARGEFHLDGEDLPKAAADFARALSANADWWGISPDVTRSRLATCQIRLGKAQEALKTVEAINTSAIADRSLAASVHDLAGWILFELDRHEEAVKRFQQCLEMDVPGLAGDGWAGIACARHGQGKVADAGAAMERALEAEPRLKGRRAELKKEGAWFTDKQEKAIEELTR
ncbi:MAG: hypothetical protein IT452_12755 [Planctomycetia bacterium]|nr:hypothetical protein [Planctomycetia bacterium]